MNECVNALTLVFTISSRIIRHSREMDRGQVGVLLIKGQQVILWKGTKIFKEEEKNREMQGRQDKTLDPHNNAPYILFYRLESPKL